MRNTLNEVTISSRTPTKSAMTKRSSKNEHPSCMASFISIFDFRNGHSNRRLISNQWHDRDRNAIGVGYSKSIPDLRKNAGTKHSIASVTASRNLYESTSNTAKIEPDQATVKELIEDEMSKAQFSESQASETSVLQAPHYLECRCHNGGNQKQTCKRCKTVLSRLNLLDSEPSSRLDFKAPHRPSLVESSYLTQQEMHVNHIKDLPSRSSMHTLSAEKLNEATQSFLDKKLKDANRLIREGAAKQSEELMHALELLNSNRELFLNLLHDPNSLLVKHIEDLRKAQSLKVGKEEVKGLMQSEKPIGHTKFRKQNIPNFFWGKGKTQDRSKCPEKTCDRSFAPSRIVVLKPIPESTSNFGPTKNCKRSQHAWRKEIESERVTTDFSIREVTRKLGNVIDGNKRKQHSNPMNGLVSMLPNGNLDKAEMREKITSKNQLRVKNPPVLHGSDHFVNSSSTYMEHSQKKGYPNFKGKPAESLKVFNVHEVSIPRRVPERINEMLPLPEHNRSPILFPIAGNRPSPGHEKLKTFHEDFQLVRENTWRTLEEDQAESSNPWKSKAEHFSSHHEVLHMPIFNLGPLAQNIDSDMYMSIGSSPKVLQAAQLSMGEVPQDMTFESNRDAPIPDKNDVMNKVEKANSFEDFQMDPSKEPVLASTSGSFEESPVLIHKDELPDINKKSEHSSPVSVLNSIFNEEISSPARPQQDELVDESQPVHHDLHESSKFTMTSLDAELHPRPLIDGKENEFEYVRCVMEASSLSYSEFIGRWHASDLPLSPALLDQVQVSSDHLSKEGKLLFDCMNEVLVEISQRFFICSPWVSFLVKNLPIPQSEHVIQEVWQEIQWLLRLQFPCTVEKLIEKDLGKAGSWMNLRFDVEAVGMEMGEAILDKIMEETILELWD